MKYRITYARVEPNPVLGEQAIRYVTARVVDEVSTDDGGALHGYNYVAGELDSTTAVILPAGAWLSVEGVEE